MSSDESDESDAGKCLPLWIVAAILYLIPWLEPDVSSKEKMNTNLSVTTDSAKNGQKRRKRVKKLVSKMFVEEDGSMG